MYNQEAWAFCCLHGSGELVRADIRMIGLGSEYATTFVPYIGFNVLQAEHLVAHRPALVGTIDRIRAVELLGNIEHTFLRVHMLVTYNAGRLIVASIR